MWESPLHSGCVGICFFVLVRCATLLRALFEADFISFEVGERLWFWSLTDVLSLSCKYLTQRTKTIIARTSNKL